MPITLSLALYGTAWFFIIKALRQRQSRPPAFVFAMICAALISHAIAAYELIITPQGPDFSLFRIAPLFFWVANLLVLVSSLRKPLSSLFVLLLPLNALLLLAALFFSGAPTVIKLSNGMLTHVILSILAYSTLAIAALHALLLAYQNHRLRNRNATGVVRLLPPLQTMESLLFELVWVGLILLTAAIVPGILFVDDMLAQHLAHKTVFSVLSWITFAILLWGRYKLGWRGNIAVRWTLTGFAFLLLAYFGSKFVLEVLIS